MQRIRHIVNVFGSQTGLEKVILNYSQPLTLVTDMAQLFAAFNTRDLRLLGVLTRL